MVSPEGNIGVGKSTLLDKIAEQEYPHVMTLKEPVSQWQNFHGTNLLDLLYKFPGRYGMLFQIYCTKTLISRQLEATDADIIIMERSVESSLLFAELQ